MQEQRPFQMEALKEMIRLINKRADSIADPKLRKSFLESVRTNRHAFQEWKMRKEK